MATPGQPHHCRHCGAVCEQDEWVCWHCDTPIEEVAEAATVEPLPLAKGASSRSSFSLASLLLLTTLVSVVLGSFAISPLVGVPLLLLLVIAGARTVWAVNVRKSHGVLVTGGQMASLLFRAVWTTLALLAALLFLAWVSGIGGGLIYSLVHVLGHYLELTRPLLEVAGIVAGWGVGLWIFLWAFYWVVWIRRDVLATDPYDFSR